MCGIAGIFNYSGRQNAISHEILKQMSDCIIERGPDSDGAYISDDELCGMSFRRLAIVDLSSNGNQPMQTADGQFSIVFNGEIYNHLDVRKQLVELGFNYRSRTDTETILYGFARWGKGVLQKLLGMWAIAIYDNRRQELFLARDRIGIKPLYFYKKDGIFLFASEIKSILAHPLVEKDFNFDELPNYLNYGLSSNRGTLFKHIYKIPAGHYLVINKDGETKLERYWSPFNKEKETELEHLTDKEIQKQLLDLLRQSIEARMMSDVPFGVFLSGGIDSSVNVALMAEIMNRPVDTFTVGFRQLDKYNELQYARKIAEIFKTNHREILIDESDAIGIMEKLAYREDEPNADPVCLPLYFLSKLTRQSGTIVVQVGEGSDEQFAGYPWIVQHYNVYEKYWKHYIKLPQFIRKSAYYAAKPVLNSTGQILALDYIRRAAYNEQFYWSGMPIFSVCHLKKLLTASFEHLAAKPAEYADYLHRQALELSPDADYYQRMAYLELTQRLAELLLMRVDKVTMSHSIEARVPFLDHRIVEFSTALKANCKMPDGKTTKYILKKAVESILPKDIIYRRKQGFAAPVEEWLRKEWHQYAQNEIMNSYFVQNNIFNKNFVEKLLAEHHSHKANNSKQIFALLMLSLWWKKYF
ncbi:MAG TPA: asparagine synthase (glutamine-hydrolyzing) [Candidatus Kapabacteria bacterium]|jgi:asparagine synthase (glutamine-hydrolysing)|nr:asparagine synthase (glutamine-hydrolyzing) [Candidatus Kapabacteria bacterium]HPP38883.1 asparagine synthase (glutamine-hydrolyzing) [Candidatus Kapabacteria bacterium]